MGVVGVSVYDNAQRKANEISLMELSSFTYCLIAHL